ncbi:MAG TPA: glycoside hydrolase family 127 protein [Kiritimatiellia bacterium]|nr:glycoside hydrolase family 127 protein [Kiritimatiellia bacterium]
MQKNHGWNRVSLATMRPSGWLASFLCRQRDGLTGHLEVAGYPFNTRGWLEDTIPLGERGGTGWWPYEQTAYWYDGMIRCGLLIGDKKLKQKARIQIDHVLNHIDSDGFMGPKCLKELKAENTAERWPFTVFFRAVMADFDERPARSTIKKMIRHYVSNTARHETARNICNIEIMAWLYEMSGDIRMKKMALESYRNFQEKEAKHGATLKNMASRKSPRDHGPTYMELFKLGAVMYRMTGDKKFLQPSINAVRKLHRDHVLIDGVPSTTEHLRGIYSTAGHETCVISDYLWSLNVMLMATGNAGYADTMEQIAFNAIPGAVTSDFKALQYFSGPNQVIAGPQTNHHPHGTAHAHISFRPNPGTECCPGNVHRAMPIFAGAMWMQDGQDGIVASLYGPGEIKVGKGLNAIHITEKTDYPFSEDVLFSFNIKKPRRIRFTFRIPAWCRNPMVTLNGKKIKRRFAPGAYHTLDRVYQDGDVVVVLLPRDLMAVKGPENSVGFSWGPLVLSLGVAESRTIEKDHRSTPDFPAWTMEPASRWNYGIPCKKIGKLAKVKIVQSAIDVDPWIATMPPIKVEMPARRIPGWKLIRRKKLIQRWGDKTRVHEGNIVFTPPLPEENRRNKASSKSEIISLVPYGATNLRLTWFPRLKK